MSGICLYNTLSLTVMRESRSFLISSSLGQSVPEFLLFAALMSRRAGQLSAVSPLVMSGVWLIRPSRAIVRGQGNQWSSHEQNRSSQIWLWDVSYSNTHQLKSASTQSTNSLAITQFPVNLKNENKWNNFDLIDNDFFSWCKIPPKWSFTDQIENICTSLFTGWCKNFYLTK